MKNALSMFIGILLLCIMGCGKITKVWNDNTFQRTLTKETLKEYVPGGAYVFGTVDKGNDILATGLMLMLYDSPDLFLPMKDNTTIPFLIDVSYECSGVGKIGVRYNYEGSVLDHWMVTGYKFSLTSNQMKFVTNEQVTIMSRIISNEMVKITNVSTTIQSLPQVYYFGRFKIKIKEGMTRDEYYVELTNMINIDQKIFMEQYPSLTNAEFIMLDSTIEK